MADANAERGEVDIVLEGATYVLRPSYEALLAIEKQVGRSIIELANEAMQLRMPMADAAIVVCEMMRAWGKVVDNKDAAGSNPRRVGELLYDASLATALPRVAIVLSLAATGGYTPSGEVKATGTTTSAPSTVA